MKKIIVLLLLFAVMSCNTFKVQPKEIDISEQTPQQQALAIVQSGIVYPQYEYATVVEAVYAAENDPVAREILIIRLVAYQHFIDQQYLAGNITALEAQSEWDNSEKYLNYFISLREVD